MVVEAAKRGADHWCAPAVLKSPPPYSELFMHMASRPGRIKVCSLPLTGQPCEFVLPFIGKQRIRRLSLLSPSARFNVPCKLRKCLRRRAHVQAMSVAVGISRRSNHNLRADFYHAI